MTIQITTQIQQALRIWLLCSDGANKYAALVGYAGPDARYWATHFVGTRMSEDWQLPPLELLGKSKKLGDFVGWMLNVPIVSERARAVFEPLVGDDVQFLRFHDLRGKPYYAMNVLRMEDYMDDALSAGQRGTNGKLFTYHRYVFKHNLPDDLPPIFKVTPMSEVFVTRRFAEAIVANKLTGACLQDPSKSGITLIASGQPLNAYPGLL